MANEKPATITPAPATTLAAKARDFASRHRAALTGAVALGALLLGRAYVGHVRTRSYSSGYRDGWEDGRGYREPEADGVDDYGENTG